MVDKYALPNGLLTLIRLFIMFSHRERRAMCTKILSLSVFNSPSTVDTLYSESGTKVH